jgi:hypothetical protein
LIEKLETISEDSRSDYDNSRCDISLGAIDKPLSLIDVECQTEVMTKGGNAECQTEGEQKESADAHQMKMGKNSNVL